MKVLKEDELMKLQQNAKKIYEDNQKEIPKKINKFLEKYRQNQNLLKSLITKEAQLLNKEQEIKKAVENTQRYINETDETIKKDSQEIQRRIDINNKRDIELEKTKARREEAKYQFDLLESRYKTELAKKVKENENLEKIQASIENITGVKIVSQESGIKVIFNKNDRQGIIYISCSVDFEIIKTEPEIPIDDLNTTLKDEKQFFQFFTLAREMFFD